MLNQQIIQLFLGLVSEGLGKDDFGQILAGSELGQISTQPWKGLHRFRLDEFIDGFAFCVEAVIDDE